MNEIVVFIALLVIAITLACVVNKFFPPDYHQRVENKYNNKTKGDN